RKLERACGGGAALLSGDDERRFAIERGRAGGSDQRRSAGALRTGYVDGRGLAADIERLGDDPGVLPVVERRRRRGKIQRRDVGAAVLPEAVACRLDRHRHRILVPIADRAFGFRLGLERRIGPGMRVDDGLAAQSQPRDVAAEFLDADQVLLPHWRYSALPLLSTTASRSSTRQRNAACPGAVRQISVRMVSPGKTTAEKRTSMRSSRLGS